MLNPVSVVKVRALERPPPGAGLSTLTAGVPAGARSAAAVAAGGWVLLREVVGRAARSQGTAEAATKLLPLTVSVTPAPPAVALLGVRALSAGTGFEAVMVKVTAAEVPPPGAGLNTVTWAVPARAISAAAMAAVNSALLTKGVTRAAPFQRAAE